MALTATARALVSLTGLSVGDAFGDQFFQPGNRVLDAWTADPPGPWAWSDDTEMACSVVDALARDGRIDQDALAEAFAERRTVARRYGVGTLELLDKVTRGMDWRAASLGGFGGAGSYGNGAAMRVAPLGAYFAGDLERASAEAVRSAEVTHAHPEGVAGAVAVAVAAAHLAGPGPHELFTVVLDHLVPCDVRRGVEAARGLSGATAKEAAARLGNGSKISAPDTVPFTLWAAVRYQGDFEGAVRACAAVGGDMDTTAAIVGGIIGAGDGVPQVWRDRREALPDWLRHEA